MAIRFGKILASNLICATALFASGCGGYSGSTAPASNPPPPPPGPPSFVPQTTFANLSATTGINHVFSVTASPLSEPAHMGGGIAAADIDQDGVIDDLDSCPLSPEDYDGDRDQDGCPDN